MSRKVGLAGFALLFGLSGGVQAATAHVTFVNPENFRFIGRYGDAHEAATNQAELAHHIEHLAATKLPADQTLDVEVLDVRLAGRADSWPYALQDLPLVPSRANLPLGNEIRVMRPQGTWPSIKLRYQLKRGEQVVASGEEYDNDMRYLDRANSYPSDDALRYEKQMLDRWFQSKLIQR